MFSVTTLLFPLDHYTILLSTTTTHILLPQRYNNMLAIRDDPYFASTDVWQSLCFCNYFYRQCTYILLSNSVKKSKANAKWTDMNKIKRHSKDFKGVLFHVRALLQNQKWLLPCITFRKHLSGNPTLDNYWCAPPKKAVIV